MTSIILEGPIAEVREREARWLGSIGDQAANFGEDGQKDRARLQRNANDLRDMFFMVVVIGEFNAGKSTFVNAMLGEEVLPMGITPTTEVIELIRYGKNKGAAPELREEGVLREWVHPNTGAPGVVIVDTPGTGSVFAKHERVAKDFLSRSDLVIFLLSAKRAFAQTERLYLELARDYGKKIILVINQIDLLEKKELQEVQSFVKQQVSETLNIEPPMFLISAKTALKGGATRGGLFNIGGSVDNAGMDNLRKYLLEAFQKTPPAKQKLLAQLDFGESMLKKYLAETQKRLDLVTDDERQAKQLREELEKQANTLNGQLETSMRELDRVFGQLRERGRAFIGENLTLKGIRTSATNKDEIRSKFETQVVGSTLQQINSISEDYVNAVLDGSRHYWRSIIERLNRMQELLKEHQVESPDAGSYSDQRLALQEAIAIADKELKSYNENNLAERLNDVFSSNLSGFNLSLLSIVGGLAAFIGVAALPGSLGAAGVMALGAVTGPFILGGGVLAYGYWRKLRNDAYQELDNRLESLKTSYRQALQDLTDKERTRLLQYGQRILAPVFSRLETIADTYRHQQTALDGLKTDGATLRADLDRIQIVSG
jgi:small GTP-binding protein